MRGGGFSLMRGSVIALICCAGWFFWEVDRGIVGPELSLDRDGWVGLLVSRIGVSGQCCFFLLLVLLLVRAWSRPGGSAEEAQLVRLTGWACVGGIAYLGSLGLMWLLSFGGMFTWACIAWLALLVFFPAVLALMVVALKLVDRVVGWVD